MRSARLCVLCVLCVAPVKVFLVVTKLVVGSDADFHVMFSILLYRKSPRVPSIN